MSRYGCVDSPRPEKEAERQEIARLTAEFEAANGRVKTRPIVTSAPLRSMREAEEVRARAKLASKRGAEARYLGSPKKGGAK